MSLVPFNNTVFQQRQTVIGSSWLQGVNDYVYKDGVNARAFGAVFNGITDDTVALQNAINWCQTNGYKRLILPVGSTLISAPLLISTSGFTLIGGGLLATQILTNTNMQALLELGPAVTYCTIQGIQFNTTGTTTQCVNIAQGATVVRFSSSSFYGSLTGDLVYSNGQNIDFDKCTWQLNSANTWAVNFDCFNQNCGLNDCRIGGSGSGVRITNVFSPANQVQGLRLCNNYFENTGAYNVWLGNSFYTTITGCVLDQSSVHAVHLDNFASGVSVQGCYLGASVNTGVNIYCAEQSSQIQIMDNFHGFGTYGVVAHATASNRVNGLTITGDVFNLPGSPASTPLLLDSVLHCNVTGCNDEAATATNGSWNTLATFGAGQYNFANNQWFTAAPSLIDLTSSYNFINERGIVGRKKGTQTASSTTSLTVNHGLFKIPATIIATPSGSNVGDFWVSGQTATQFTINWTTSGSPAWYWEADASQ